MRKNFYKGIIFALLLSLALNAAGCSFRPRPARTEDGNTLFRLGFSGAPDTLNPYAASTAEAEAVLSLIYDRLFAEDPATGELTGSLCADYTVTDAAAGGKLWSIALRPGVIWQDGKPLTASDVEFSLQSQKDFSTLYGYPECELLDVTGIAVEDDTHLAMVVWGEESYIKSCLSRIPILPRHVWNEPEYMRYDNSGVPADYRRARRELYSFGGAMIGSGPYELKSVDGSVCTLYRSGSYREKLGGPEAVELRFSMDDPAAALNTGEIDGCWDMSLSALQSLSAEKQTWVTAGAPGELYLLTFDLRSAGSPVRETAVRAAVEQCADKAAILLTAFGGGYVQTGLFSPFSPWSDPAQSARRAYDPAAAAETLAKAGYMDLDGDGVREKNGTPLALTLLCSGADSAWERAGRILAASCSAAGIRLTVDCRTPEETAKALAAGEYDLYLSSRSTVPEPELTLSLFRWDGGDNAFAVPDGRGGVISRGWNDSGFSSAEYDELCRAVAAETDPTKKKDLVRRAEELLSEEIAAVPIGSTVRYQACSRVWAGLRPDRSGLYFRAETLCAQLRGMSAGKRVN